MTLLNPAKRPFLSPSSTFASSFFGRTLHMQQIRRNLELLAQTDLPVLLEGESGTGKDVVAELLHLQSKNSDRLAKLSCVSREEITTVLDDLLEASSAESELATLLRDGGTVLLDGIHELDLTSQSKLLIILNQHDTRPSGGRFVRVISTTTVDLQGLIDAGKFRIDLLYRINAVKVILPPLRERSEDIRGLVEFFLEKHSRETMRPRPILSQDVMQMMEGYFWPGNIRQMDNLLRNFVLMGSEELITRELMDSKNGLTRNWALDQVDVSHPVALKEITRQVTQDLERQIILKVLQANGWNRQKTAKWLSISYRSLLYKLSDYGASQHNESNVHTIPSSALHAANY
ncbi:sigma-54-dependent transcriptional regulator [Terriglobus roseus]|uniref:Two-component system, NtrC family, response regulator AtoC n=1 Tax=Terriglobus roseus TaxID=392734 RepID=A0A1H4JNM5_9BACT|nr:sigma 54-interacting transcriptional regulator [Terriglobus roseus]SEB47863.1 two-component system, NtrC family, response regulator AtoC [Terriglobus roseus]